jgi:hypothetical protein
MINHMKLKQLFVIIALLLTTGAYAQTGRSVKGMVADSTKATIPGAVVKLFIGTTDSLITTTGMDGIYSFPSVKANEFSIQVTSIGYDGLRRHINLDNANTAVFLKPIILKQSSTMLSGVTIKDVVPVKIKEDTIDFNTAAYPVRQEAMVEDVVKKLPGAYVDANGNITFQGKTVSKVRVNGKDFFGGDVRTATQNIPANAISSIQMINDYGDQANLTGIKSGEPETVMNITVKPGMAKSVFGQLTAGDGRDAIPQVDGTTDQNRYQLQGNYFRFNDGQQLAFLGNLNNTNTSLFNFGPPGSNNTPTSGITTTRTAGFNYRDSWGKKITVYGSYSFSDNTVFTKSSTIQDNLSLTNPTTQVADNTETDRKVNHRFTFNIEYKIDSIDYLKISPSFSYAGVNSTSFGSSTLSNDSTTLSNYNYNTISHSSAPSFGVNVLYNHRFSPQGRNFSINAGAGSSQSNSYTNPQYQYINTPATVPLDQFITTDSRTDTVGASVSYIEPLSRKSFLEAKWVYHRGYTTDDKTTDTLTNAGQTVYDDMLSNDYHFTLTTNRYGLNYRFIDKKYNYTLGIVAQPTSLNGYSPSDSATTHRNTFYVTPDAHFVYNFSRSQSFSANYSGSTNTPTFNELQPVTDFSNALYPVTGNPDLKPEFNRTLSLRYNNFDFQSGNVFFGNLSFTQTDDKIVSNTINYPRNFAPDTKFSNTIATDYLNAPGYYSTSAFFVFHKPWDNRKYNLFLIGNASYSNNISYITNVDSSTYAFNTEKNIAKTLSYTQEVHFRVDITDVIDAEPYVKYTINSSSNSLNEPGINDNFRTFIPGITGKNYFWKNWTLSYDYSKTLYYGYKGATNPNILNTYVERRFLKDNMASIRFAVNDVFNENTGYTNTINGNYITQSNVNRLGRYYMLSFIWRFRKSNGNNQNMRRGPDGEMHMGPPPGGGPGGPPM